MTSFRVFLCCLFLPAIGAAQPPIAWQRSVGTEYEDQMYAIAQISDGGFVLAGISKSPDGHGGADIAVIRVDANGMPRWRKLYGGSYYDETRNIVATGDGGFILAGSSDSKDGDITAHHGNINVKDAWIVKIDSVGTLEWQRSIGGDAEDGATSVCQAHDGNFIVAGVTNSSATGDFTDSIDHRTMFLAKLSSQGDLVWLRSYDTTSISIAYSITPTNDTGFIVGAINGSSNSDAIVAKFDGIGALLWTQTYGGGGNDYLSPIRQTSDGGFICGGNSNSSDGDLTHNWGPPGSGNYDAWFAKLDAEGNRVWMASYGGIDQDLISSIRETADGGFIAAGSTSSPEHDVIGYHGPDGRDAWIVKLSAAGDMQWNKAYGGSSQDYATDIVESSDGEYIFVGTAMSTNGDVSVPGDVWLVKLGTGLGGVPDRVNTGTTRLTIKSLSENPVTDADLACRFNVNGQGHVVLSICNMLGQVVSRTDYGILAAGDHTCEVSTDDLPSGMYLCTFSLDGFETSQRFSVQR